MTQKVIKYKNFEVVLIWYREYVNTDSWLPIPDKIIAGDLSFSASEIKQACDYIFLLNTTE